MSTVASLAQAELGLLAPAVKDLETYLGQAAEGEDALAIAQRVAALRRAMGSVPAASSLRAVALPTPGVSCRRSQAASSSRSTCSTRGAR